jgi:hypothetical protein
MSPDFIYVTGRYHRDWMDIFLFHVSVDEILPYAVVVETVVGLLLLGSYFYFRVGLLAARQGDSADERKQQQASLL